MYSVTSFYKLPNMYALRQERTEKALWYTDDTVTPVIISQLNQIFFSPPPPLKWQHEDKECNHLLNRDDIVSLEDARSDPVQAKKSSIKSVWKSFL